MQAGPMQWGTLEYIFAAFAIATALGVLLQACILLGMAIGLRRLLNKVEHLLGVVDEHALPLIASSKVTLQDLGPKLKTISANLVEVSETLKHESNNVKRSVDDVLERTRVQTARVDGIVSGTLDGITTASSAIQKGIEVPLRHVQGIFNGLRAGFDVLREKKNKEPIEPVDRSEAEFVVVEEVTAARQVF